MAIDQEAYCTLVMSDNYLPGAAVLAHSLRDSGTKKKLAVMVTLDTLQSSTITELKSLYDYVLPVDRIANPAPSNLYLMDRGDLLYAFTKINLWRLTQFKRIVYLDADIVSLRAPDELFNIEASFAAAPDVGWPDFFNTGVMALTPHMGEYWALQTLASSGDSFDGADQGLLNQFYEHKSWHRLSFLYNCTPSANYQYEPAYRYHKSGISNVHFIGKDKPWMTGRPSKAAPGVYTELTNRWWAVYDRHYRSPAEPHSSADYTPPSYAVQSRVKGEQTYAVNDYSSAGYPADKSERSDASTVKTTPSFADRGFETQENIQVEQTPTVNVTPFSAPQSEWDATRAPPPQTSKPEAANFPSQQYGFNEDHHLYKPPTSYPEPPKDLWYEVPKSKPNPPAARPPAIFPWEQRGEIAKPTRRFAEDEPPPLFIPSNATNDAPATPTTPTIAITSIDGQHEVSGSGKNAWDEVVGIDEYVRRLGDFQKLRGKLQVLNRGYQQPLSPENEQTPSSGPSGGRRESLIVTDFPSAIERPSLPVTPAPVRRPTFWGQERDQEGRLPQAEGVPDQAEWNPTERLEELRRSSIIDPITLTLPSKNVPKRQMPRSSISGPSGGDSEPHVHFLGGNVSQIVEIPAAEANESPSKGSPAVRPTFGEVNFAPSDPIVKEEEILSPTEHGSRSFN